MLTVFASFCIAAHHSPRAAAISDYRPILGLSASHPGSVYLRRYSRSGQDSTLTPDPTTLATSLERVPEDMRLVDWDAVRASFPACAWLHALDKARAAGKTLLDAGIRRSDRPEDGVDLTVDLCPSRKPLDRGFFRDVLSALEDEQKPVPIGLSLSGSWMTTHESDLEWLESLAKAGRIRPVWIDHSYHHRVSPTASLPRNFLLEPSTKLDEEVFRTEMAMIDRGMVPSPFFRFPGLVSRDSLVERILSWGLVPVGSEAWLAKGGQRVHDGSIVLVHANGNEPLGLMRFRLQLRQHREEIRSHHWFLYDLRESVADRPSIADSSSASGE